ncbi:DUF779 domain-containing protein [Burkholderia gladioli]|jgi:uncharacterized protein (DUF779 family)|uniref:DUF779 domain-containing protein n=1 Tax=Burkholderia gladioli TaxID=28095 RepID=A0AAW3F6T4_BURGA|nr:DUF779 domain-containing protein [Burkholderia gladioli]AJX00387.1 hypothetical protein BM43_1207 [Burkholderia gladioli]ASD81062.1 acetaldehyde dehydrogenase [Burkholderia gladioli pv. gladioli]AWY53706.1 acetaldehyde dehydrogenase [Burkholderia gladioli pv. gladioli]KGC16983.1 hypothetical protein DM48_4439 [Burkholderia gladioli]MDD1786510.1 DUF779 domain-containing protein [Burkholderia gladioli]
MSELPQRVVATDAARKLIQTLSEKHGKLMFHQSGGCCDGSAPMCLQDGELIIGGSDVCLGSIEGMSFYMSDSQYESWKHTQLIVDVIPGNGGMFSLEQPTGMRFLTRSRLFSDEELQQLGMRR